jgi:hypothetical protein
MSSSPQFVSQQFSVAKQNTLAATQRLIVTTAKTRHGEIMNSDPQPGSFRRWVDGVLSVAEEMVKPDGIIKYNYNRLDLVVQFAMETLFEKSPVLSGDYRNAHTIFMNGVEVSNLADYKSGYEIVILNPLPYARKIEIGKMKMTVPGTDQVYHQAEQIVKSKYDNFAKIAFDYRGVVDGIVFGKSGPRPKRTGPKPGRESKRPAAAQNRSDLRYPALVISERL